jgi:hypothetical protein
MKFDDYKGEEQINKEYKEFMFNTNGIFIDTKQADQLCLTNKFEFNKEVISNLNKYIPVFFSKYLCGCLNSNIKNSNFYIGIDDFGFTKGFPYQGVLPKKYLTKHFLKSINESVKHNTKSDFNFNELIEIKFIKLKYENANLKNSTHPEYTRYLKEKQKYINARNDYIEKLNNWKIRFAFINQKLVDLAHNFESRNMIIEYIKQRDPKNPVIELLLSGYEVIYEDHFKIAISKENPENPYYWITRWKDEVSLFIRSQKPKFKQQFKYHRIPINLIMNCNEMIPYWMENNENMNIYVVQIKIKKTVENNCFSYYSIRDKKWSRCKRVLLNGTIPSCYPY